MDTFVTRKGPVYFKLLPKELVYELSYYLSLDDIQQVSQITGGFNDYYFWENYVIHLGLIFIKPLYMINNMNNHFNWVTRIISANEYSDRWYDDLRIKSYFEGILYLPLVPTDILFRLDIDKLKNLAIGVYNVTIRCIKLSKFYLSMSYDRNNKLEIEVSESDVRKLLVYYKYYEVTPNS